MAITLKKTNEKSGDVEMLTFSSASQAAEVLQVMLQQRLAEVEECEAIELFGFQWTKDSDYQSPPEFDPKVQKTIIEALVDMQSEDITSVQKIADVVGCSHSLVRKSLLALCLTGRVSKVPVADHKNSFKRYKYIINKEE